MAEAALDYDYFEPDETLEIPEGGIADFLTAKTGSWSDDDVPSSGIARVKHVVDQLAEYGRFDDEYMVHAAPNETVVPFPVLDANPSLRLALYAQMRAMGLEPERYTVGNDLNSINPVTGQREFGILKKIKKFFKKVVKVIKKIAPIVLPIILSLYPPLGMIYGSMLGSGIGTLIQGGSFKDALKSAALSGVTAGIMKGVRGGIKGMRDPTSTFKAGAAQALQEGFRPGLAAKEAALQQKIVDDLASPETGVDVSELTADVDIPDVPFPPPGDVVPTGPPVTEMGLATPDVMARQTLEPLSQVLPQTRAAAYGNLAGDNLNVIDAATPTAAGVTGAATTGIPVPSFEATPPTRSPFALPEGWQPDAGAGTDAGAGGIDVSAVDAPVDFLDMTEAQKEAFKQQAILEQQQPSFFDRLKPGEDFNLMEAFRPTGPTKESLWARYFGKLKQSEVTPEHRDFINAVFKAKGVTPGLLRRYGPLLGASMLASRVAAGQEEEEPESLFGTGTTGSDLLTENPEEYTFAMNMPVTDFPIQQWDETGTGPQTTIQWAPTGAGGGDVDSYPPRIGGINGPGTGTSDDVPAMLSDGEFVFTAKAVKGAGNGSRKSGTSNLYSLMRNFEGRV